MNLRSEILFYKFDSFGVDMKLELQTYNYKKELDQSTYNYNILKLDLVGCASPSSSATLGRHARIPVASYCSESSP